LVKKIILDMDPGIDDALALMAACSGPAQVLGVTTVAGNLPLTTVTANASGLLKQLDTSIHVYPGAAAPLCAKTEHASQVHGPSGLGHWQVEADASRVESRHAAQFIAETARAHPHQVTLVATGPLTNLALALEHHGQDMQYLDQVVFMGGALTVPGNATPVSEFNIYADPDAAELVLGSGLNLTMVGLDVTHQVCLQDQDLAELARGGQAAAAAMVQYYIERNGDMPLHDPLALLAALRPDLFKFQPVPVRVEVRGQDSRGQTMADFSRSHGWEENAQVALQVQSQRCKDFLMGLWSKNEM